jgi:transcriptional regulator with XRE-family HTH domain
MVPVDELIRAARQRAGLTQKQLAQRLAVSQPVVARLERRGANPRVSTLDRVIAATGHGLDMSLTPDFGIDESMIAADLKLTHDQRLRNFESFYDFAKGAREAAARGRGS